MCNRTKLNIINEFARVVTYVCTYMTQQWAIKQILCHPTLHKQIADIVLRSCSAVQVYMFVSIKGYLTILYCLAFGYRMEGLDKT